MNLVLFLGAGFSHPFGHPVMNEFFSVADASPRINDDDRDFLGRLLLEARRANSFLESSPTNLEDVLSFSVMSQRLDLLSASEEDRHGRLCGIIQKIYAEASPVGYWDRYEPLSRLIGAKPDRFQGSLSVVTTNYDLNFESACVHFQTPVDPGFEVVRESGGNVRMLGRLYGNGPIKLYKLHGSVNWYRNADETGLTVEDRVVQVDALSDRQLAVPYVCAGNYPSPRPPVIIPPSFLKPELDDVLTKIWQDAAASLSEANVVAFIGYSFPASDTEMRYFLASALMDNPGIRAVHVVDPNAVSIVERLRRPSSKLGSHFRDLLNPLEGTWTESALPLAT